MCYKLLQIIPVDLVTHDGNLHDLCIEPPRHITCQVYCIQDSKFLDNPIHNLINSQMLVCHLLQFVIERESGVYPIDLLVSLLSGGDQSCLFEPIEFNPDRVGAVVELFSQTTQPCSGIRVQKKPEQQFETGFGLDKSTEHGGNE